MAIREKIKQSLKINTKELDLCLSLLTYFEGQAKEPLPFYMYAQIAERFPKASSKDLVQVLDVLAQSRFGALKKIYFIFLSDDSIYEFNTKEIIEIINNGSFEHPETNKTIEDLNKICFAYEIGEELLKEVQE